MPAPVVYTEASARFYLIESVQEVLGIYGENCVVTGMEIEDVNINNGKLSFVITQGSVICDKTFIEFPEPTPIELNLINSEFEKLIVLVSYRYLRTTRPNLATLSVKSIDTDSHCSNWLKERDKLVLAVINREFDIIKSNIINEECIIINSQEYIIYPYNNTIRQLRPFLQNISSSNQ